MAPVARPCGWDHEIQEHDPHSRSQFAGAVGPEVPPRPGRFADVVLERRGAGQRSIPELRHQGQHHAQRGVRLEDLLSQADPSGGRMLAPPLECDSSLRDMLAPLVAERLHLKGGISPPNLLEVAGVLAAISAVAAPSSNSTGSHFAGACGALAMHGFRQCSLVVDKLGVSVRCTDSQAESGQGADQVDFPWSSISDVQDPRLKRGLQGCAVTLGVREPSRLGEGPPGALALVLRLADHDAAQRLADTVLAFKAYEAQTALWNKFGRTPNVTQGDESSAVLMLDERGSAFWSLAEDDPWAASEEAKLCLDAYGGTISMESAAPVPPCCQFCWC